MSVGRSYQFSLDPSASDGPVLSGGSVYVGASGGLPARITGQIDYEARVLALNPTGYWPLNEASGSFLDRTANARHLSETGAVFAARGVTGAARGGQSSVGVREPQGTNYSISAAANYPEHRLVAGVPYTALLWMKGLIGPVAMGLLGSSTDGINNTAPGWYLRRDNQTVDEAVLMRLRNGAGTLSVSFEFHRPALRNYSHCIDFNSLVLRYNGGALNSLASWSLQFNGTEWTKSVLGIAQNPSDVGAVSPFTIGIKQNYGETTFRQDVAVWAGVRLTDAQLKSIALPLSCGRALWTLPTAATSRDFRAFIVPGSLARSISATESRKGVRCYYSLNGAHEVEFDPGDDLDVPVTIPAGQTFTVAADLTHYHLDDLPWIADSAGGGPTLIYDEADPITEISSIDSSSGQIDITFSGSIGSAPIPTSAAQPAVQITSATVSGSTLTLLNEPGEVAVTGTGPLRIAYGMNVWAYTHLDFGGMSPKEPPSSVSGSASFNEFPPPPSGYATTPAPDMLTWAPSTDANISRYDIYSGPTVTGSWTLLASISATLSLPYYYSGAFNYLLPLPTSSHYRLDAVDMIGQSGTRVF